MPEEFDYEVVDSTKPTRKAGIKAAATITKIELTTAVKIFGAAAARPEQAVWAIYVKTKDWEGRVATINKPASRFIGKRSKLYLFKAQYKAFPKVGMKVQLVTNARGYWNLVL